MSELREVDADAEPMLQFARWYGEARDAQPLGFDAGIVATSVGDVPSARAVIVRAIDQRGFVFYTDRTSRKGRELTVNPRASLIFLWHTLERQVRVDGPVEVVSEAESDAYWATRPRGSTIAAWASQQSAVIQSRDVLEQRVRELEGEFGDGPVPRPPRWGGYRISPEVIEFWQGRPNRLHDRLRYRRMGDAWVLERLSP